MWTKKDAGEYQYKDYSVVQLNGLGWCLLKGKEGIGRFKSLKQVKAYVAGREA